MWLAEERWAKGEEAQISLDRVLDRMSLILCAVITAGMGYDGRMRLD